MKSEGEVGRAVQGRAEALRKSYLGDGVYAHFTKFGELVLTTEDGVSVTNSIVLEPEVLNALTEYLAAVAEYRAVAAASEGA